MKNFKSRKVLLLYTLFFIVGVSGYGKNVLANTTQAISLQIQQTGSSLYLNNANWNATYPTGHCSPSTGVTAYVAFASSTELLATSPYTLTSVSNCNQLDNTSSIYNPTLENGVSVDFSTLPAGLYYVDIMLNCTTATVVNGLRECTSNDALIYYTSFIWDGSNLQTNTNTHIQTVTPYNGELLSTSSTFTVGSTGYLNSVDLNSNSQLNIRIRKYGENFLLSQCADVACSQDFSHFQLNYSYPLLTASTFSYSSTTTGLPIGKYEIRTQLVKGQYCIFGYCASTVEIVSTTTTFTVSTTTSADIQRERTFNVIDTIGKVSSTTDFSSCAIANFNLLYCGADLISYAFVPTSDAITSQLDVLHDEVLTAWPIGYITDFITIMSTTTIGTLTPIDGTIPAIGGTNAGLGTHIHLDITHGLDVLLNATSTMTASSTETFYDVTEYYWEIVVILGALVYLFYRITGFKKHDH